MISSLFSKFDSQFRISKTAGGYPRPSIHSCAAAFEIRVNETAV